MPAVPRSASRPRAANAPEPGAATDRAPPLPGLTSATARSLARLGVQRSFDLVLHLPLRYEDETRVVPIAQAPHGAVSQVEGVVVDAQVKFRPRRQLVVRVEDPSGGVTVRLLNFWPSQQQQLAPGRRVRLAGDVKQGFFGAEMVHPRIRVVAEHAPLPDRLTPVYPTTAGLSQFALRAAVTAAMKHADLTDTVPAEARAPLGLPAFDAAVRLLHDPPPEVALDALESRRHPAWQRIKFDELLAQQLSMRQHRQRRDARRAPVIATAGAVSARLAAQCGFTLTDAQQRCVAEIRRDLARTSPMQRLLQGDVGSGKTIVAAHAVVTAVEAGWQVAVMAPTEILAEQHHARFRQWLAPLGLHVAWLAGSLGAKAKREALAAVESGQAQVAVGTHALFQDAVVFDRLALAIVDEQHRFGVHQRLALRSKGEAADLVPHQLMMSATPIPRTLAMSFYADLDVSVIDQLPPGRTPVVTRLLSAARRAEVEQRVRDACLAGQQAYWVCPLIEESEQLQLKTAEDTFAVLSATFPELRVGLVHGRLPAAQKAATMDAFKHNALQLLVATTVIEVGVDVPNATLMVIEHAERMGLSQLHQLRGRVGRGRAESACILLFQPPVSDTARARLQVIRENDDGFVIAQEDLKLRGPGELLGARQSGVPMLRFADLDADAALLDAARAVADHMLATDPSAAQAHVDRWLGGRTELLRV
jgi:ATP-dependent DNA helicase RecG